MKKPKSCRSCEHKRNIYNPLKWYYCAMNPQMDFDSTEERYSRCPLPEDEVDESLK